MGTKIEAFHFEKKVWLEMGEIPPGMSAAITQNLPEDGRLIYLFQCDPENRGTIIARKSVGILVDSVEALSSQEEKFEPVKILTSADSPYILTFRPDNVEQRRIARVTHTPNLPSTDL